ncbi:MAG: Na+/H+ antiporter NhaA [Syntrophaceae bacterium]|nr:Na+/H+ antiporter NhaA [Syntrophaceae bacterium]
MKPIHSKRALFNTGAALGELLLTPFNRFASMEVAGGVLLVLLTIIALIWSNSDFAGSYEWLKHLSLEIRIGAYSLDKPLHFWINDGLMTFFFFMVGLEIKREVLVGELASLKRASLPLLGALGGMIAPAVIYYMLNAQTPSEQGWAIPMATDIAFTLAALTLLGSKAPHSLRIFVTALAIVDDIGAVIVIATYYSSELAISYLFLASFFIVMLISFNILGFRRPLPYIIVGSLVWWAVYMSGVHSTIAGILVAFTVPARSRRDMPQFRDQLIRLVDRLRRTDQSSAGPNSEENSQTIIRKIEDLCEDAQTPLQRMEQSLHPWVVYWIVPLFALANAGVFIQWGRMLDILTTPVSLGVTLGLLVGKQLGIFVVCWVAIRMRFAMMPSGVTFSQIYGASILCGIGFTMSIFVANLAFGESTNLDYAKISILVGSLLSFFIGLLVLSIASPTITGVDEDEADSIRT